MEIPTRGRFLETSGSITGGTDTTAFSLEMSSGVESDPKVVFEKIKKDMKPLETLKYNRQIKKLEKYYFKLIENGQMAFSKQVSEEIFKKVKEIEAYSRGIKMFIEGNSIIELAQQLVRGKNLSITNYSDYKRIIPEDIISKKKSLENLFDDFQILHADGTDLVKEEESLEEAVKREKDPVLFGRFNESTRMYFIADWEDEFCDLTFDDLVDELELNDDDVTLKKHII